MINIGIIGLGWMGEIHAELIKLNDGCRIEAICDKNTNILQQAQKKYQVKAYDDHLDLLDEDKIDAIIIATPATSHYKIIKDCIKADKHILCEKPLALSAENINQIRSLVNKSSKKFMICFPARFAVSIEEAKAIINQGLIGDINYIRGNFRFCMKSHDETHGDWVFDRQQGGGLILEASVHLWDTIRYLSGKEIIDVFGIANEKLINGTPLEDNFAALAHFDNEGIANIDMSGSLPHKTPTDKRFEIIGTKGCIYLDEFDSYIKVNSEIGVEASPGKKTKGFTYPDVMWHSKVEGGVKRLQQEFIRCINKNLPAKPGVEDGARACEITWAIMDSLKSGKLETVKYGK